MCQRRRAVHTNFSQRPQKDHVLKNNRETGERGAMRGRLQVEECRGTGVR